MAMHEVSIATLGQCEIAFKFPSRLCFDDFLKTRLLLFFFCPDHKNHLPPHPLFVYFNYGTTSTPALRAYP